MFKIKVINNQQCVLEGRTVNSYSNIFVKYVFKQYDNPSKIHIDIEDEQGELIATYHWNEVKNCGYRGYVMDRMDTLETRKTKLYGSYKEAHDAAARLAKKYFSSGRYELDVQQQ